MSNEQHNFGSMMNLLYVMCVALAMILAGMCILLHNIDSTPKDPKPRCDEQCSPISETRFCRPTRPTFQPTDLLPYSDKDFKVLKVVIEGWDRLEVVGNENYPSNHFQPSWTSKPLVPLKSWTVGQVGRLLL